MKCIANVLEEVGILVDMHFNEFNKTHSSMFLKIISNQNSIEMKLFKKTWRTLNCSQKR